MASGAAGLIPEFDDGQDATVIGTWYVNGSRLSDEELGPRGQHVVQPHDGHAALHRRPGEGGPASLLGRIRAVVEAGGE